MYILNLMSHMYFVFAHMILTLLLCSFGWVVCSCFVSKAFDAGHLLSRDGSVESRAGWLTTLMQLRQQSVQLSRHTCTVPSVSTVDCILSVLCTVTDQSDQKAAQALQPHHPGRLQYHPHCLLLLVGHQLHQHCCLH